MGLESARRPAGVAVDDGVGGFAGACREGVPIGGGAPLAPTIDGRGFQVKLEGVDGVTPAERLVLAAGRPGQMNGALRKIERVAMPVKNAELDPESWKRMRSDFPAAVRADRVPAHFALLVGVHARSQRLGDELRAEADAEDGFLFGQNAFR